MVIPSRGGTTNRKSLERLPMELKQPAVIQRRVSSLRLAASWEAAVCKISL